VLDKKIAKTVTPNVVPPEAMIFQPSNERRKSGSHYTPSSLTGPIVEGALAPVLKQLGENPKPEQILNLKVCDPAMGSGAFLVEACRQLGDELMKAWHAYNDLPLIPADEEEVLYAQRMVAQQCLYGVDKNPMAVDLAKLSLWLATLAKNHQFTFLDHSLRCGDSLVGLTRQQIATFDWQPGIQQSFLEEALRKDIKRVTEYRTQILSARDEVPYGTLKEKLQGADESLEFAREIGDSTLAAFFSADKPRTRESARLALRADIERVFKDVTDIEAINRIERAVTNLRRSGRGVSPFHWELEFPEVFATDHTMKHTPGFDVIVGNPPFLGGTRISTVLGDSYLAYLNEYFTETGNRMDLVAYFFRRAYDLLRIGGTFGLIATNTISQGDTRSGGLTWICKHGGVIFGAKKRMKWPGTAAVVVSVVHVAKEVRPSSCRLDGRAVDHITSFLFRRGGNENPYLLRQNTAKSFIGSYVLGMGFVFDDSPNCTPLSEMKRLVDVEPRNAERIFPFIGGEEINESPTLSYSRYVINFDQMSEAEARRWPMLMQILENKVKPERQKKAKDVAAWPWWHFWRVRPELYSAIKSLDRVLVISRVTECAAWAFQPTDRVFSDRLTVVALSSWAAFAIMQSRVHEEWARFFGSTLEDRLIYNNTDCFETFPFPSCWASNAELESAGREYYEFRSALMLERNLGLTELYNQFHNPEETDSAIARQRELHAAMDAAVLKAYGWTSLRQQTVFSLTYEDEGDGGETANNRRKKPWRCRWIEESREEIIALLLELNRQRAIEEGQVVPDDHAPLPDATLEKTNSKKPKAKRTEQGSASDQITMNLGEA
jgi:hypothetical protein